MAEQQHGERVRERLVSIECAHCGREIAYSGTGRRPRYCSPTCRSRSYELRQAAARLGRPDPMPAVVREVVERVVERDRPVEVPAVPRVVAEWVPMLEQLERQVRERPLSLVRGPDDWAELADAVRGLYGAFSWRVPEPDDTTPAAPRPGDDTTGLSRQQRRARERERRKRR